MPETLSYPPDPQATVDPDIIFCFSASSQKGFSCEYAVVKEKCSGKSINRAGITG